MSHEESRRAQTGEGTEPGHTFSPLRRAPRRKLIAAMLLGPVLWVAALAVLVTALRDDDAVEFGLVIALGAFVVAFICLTIGRFARARNDEAW